MSDLIRREDALDIAYRRSASNNYFVSAAGADIAHAIRALPADTVQAQIDAAVKAAASTAKSTCSKCGGDGWLWGYELDSPPGEEAPSPDDTRYSCDGGGCKASAAIRKGDQP